MNKFFSSIGEFIVNYSSLICLIDCILLPCIVILLGFLNVLVNIEPFQKAAHIIELCLVIPFGSISILVNFKRSKNVLLFISGSIGISVVILSHFFNDHTLHTVFSLLGCLILITSNFLARKFYKKHNCHETHDGLTTA